MQLHVSARIKSPSSFAGFHKGKVYVNYVCNIIKICNFLYKLVQPEDGVTEAKTCG